MAEFRWRTKPEAGSSRLGGVGSAESSEGHCLLEEVEEEDWARPSGEAGDVWLGQV